MGGCCPSTYSYTDCSVPKLSVQLSLLSKIKTMTLEFKNYYLEDYFLSKDGVVIAGIDALMTASSGPDNGFLNCCASKYSGALRHANTHQAIDNLAGSLGLLGKVDMTAGKRLPWIGGHGSAGFMTTGSGQNGTQDGSNTIGTWNEGSWGPEFDQLKSRNFPILTLLSCDTGAGDDGADLLLAIANRIGKPVRARTGLTTCGDNGITFQNGSTWQVANPGQRPNPIPEPTLLFDFSVNVMKLEISGVFEEVPLESVSRISITRPYKFLRQSLSESSVNLDKKDSQAILRLINFSEPFNPGGMPAAMVTAKIAVFFDGKEDSPRHFDVYNNRLLHDLDCPKVFYQAAPGFSTVLKGII
jgi:hypothetical protein